MSLIRFGVAVTALLLAGGALAQDAPRVAIRGTIESISGDGATLDVRSRAGERTELRLKAPRRVIAVIPAKLADIKPGLFIGVAALPGADGALRAMEVHIFPETMRGVGEGFRPFDLAPGSTMTNGAVNARIEGVDGPKLTVTYKGGSQTILVDRSTPIVTFAPGAPGDLKAGAAIVARGVRAADGVYETSLIQVGRDGLTPPM